MEHDRLPPQNIDAELSVLGSMLLEPAAILEAADVLRPGDFYRDTHQAIYRAIMALNDSGEPVDALTLIEELNRRGEFDKVGGDDAIRKILESPPHAANARYYAEIVHQKAIARELIEAGNAILRDGYSNSYSSDELRDRAEQLVFAVGQGRSSAAVPIGDLIREATRRIVDRAEGLAAPGLMTGFGDLDDLLGGLTPGNLVVLAARPGMGKTALALGLALHVAGHLGVGSLFVSLEMGGGELAERLLSNTVGIASSKIKVSRFLTDAERHRVAEMAPLFDGMPLWVDESPILTPTQVAATARRFKARHDIGLVVVDYLQLVSAEDERSPRQEQVAATSRRLKAMAKEIDAPVLVLAQLNRQSERREDRRPMLSDLRESGQIEQDADVVMLLHRPSITTPTTSPASPS